VANLPVERRGAGPAGPFLKDGIMAGLLGAAAVALWYLVLDAIRGQVLFTPAALWSGFFMGADRPEAVVVSAGPVIGYTLLHLAAWSLIGVITAALLGRVDRQPAALHGFVLLAVTSITLFIGLVSIAAVWLVDVLPWWTIAVANILAAGAMVGYLWRRLPALSRALRSGSLEEPA
jgi:hypothetical protein